jgi:hypothetical protein
MRILHLPTLAVGLGLAGLSIGGLAAFGGIHNTAAAATLAPAVAASSTPVVSSACQQLPVASTATPSASASDSASPSPTAAASTPTPVDLCIGVQATADSIQAGQQATWNVEAWVQNGPVTGVTISLAGTLVNELPTFTSDCPGGNGSTSCTIGDMGSGAEDEMQAQITVPSDTGTGTSVTLTATANASPGLSEVPAASTAVTVAAAPSPSPSASPSSSATPAKSATPSPSSSKQAAATTPAATTPAASLPGVGTVPVTSTTLPPSEVSEVTNPGSISSLLPVVTPGATPSPTSGFVTAPAADSQVGPSASADADRTSASNFVLVVPTGTAEKIAVVVLLVVVAVALRMRANKLAPLGLPARASRGARTEPSPGRRRKPSALFNRRRPRGDDA